MNRRVNPDRLGITVSLACAIHCALLPLFFTSLPIFGINVIENAAFEIIMVVLAFIVGAYSLYLGKKHHHSLLPIIIFSIGFIFLLLKLFFVEYENWLIIPAVFGIVFAHIINYKSSQRHNHAQKQNCTH